MESLLWSRLRARSRSRPAEQAAEGAPGDRRVRHPEVRDARRPYRALVGVPVLRAHQERAGGDEAEVQAVLVHCEGIEHPPPPLGDRCVARRDAVRPVERARQEVKVTRGLRLVGHGQGRPWIVVGIRLAYAVG